MILVVLSAATAFALSFAIADRAVKFGLAVSASRARRPSSVAVLPPTLSVIISAASRSGIDPNVLPSQIHFLRTNADWTE
jgi:hypothetical protein